LELADARRKHKPRASPSSSWISFAFFSVVPEAGQTMLRGTKSLPSTLLKREEGVDTSLEWDAIPASLAPSQPTLESKAGSELRLASVRGTTLRGKQIPVLSEMSSGPS
jgi:hypothetical protein